MEYIPSPLAAEELADLDAAIAEHYLPLDIDDILAMEELAEENDMAHKYGFAPFVRSL